MTAFDVHISLGDTSIWQEIIFHQDAGGGGVSKMYILHMFTYESNINNCPDAFTQHARNLFYLKTGSSRRKKVNTNFKLALLLLLLLLQVAHTQY